VNCIEKIDVPKKASRPISLHLLPNFELLAEMKVLQLQFLDDDGISFPSSSFFSS
jgi:hypothetical protein